MLSDELKNFYIQWNQKASNYPITTVTGCYDKYFTLFVVFNRLYAEATFELSKEHDKRDTPKKDLILKDKKPFPDKKAATEYVLRYISKDSFGAILQEHEVSESIKEITRLIENKTFGIVLSRPYSNIQPSEDEELANGLSHRNPSDVLKLIYQVRCNLLHGNKELLPVQVELLQPALIILEAVIKALYGALTDD